MAAKKRITKEQRIFPEQVEKALRVANSPIGGPRLPDNVWRQLHKKEPAPKDTSFEQGMLNMLRKLRQPEALALYCMAERLAVNRIEERLISRKGGVSHG